MKRLLPLIVLVLLITSFGITFAQDGPPVERIGVDFGVVGGYRYMRVIGSSVPVLDAPEDGDVLYRFEGGYDFVTPRSQEGEWVEINPGEWVHEDNLFEVYASQFNGVRILGASSAPWGWILVNHHASAAPGGAEVLEDAFRVQKYQLATFYNAVPADDGWVWYDIGGGRWVRQTFVSKVNFAGNPGISGRWVAVDLYEQNLVAYEGNTPVFATLVSSGLPGNDTNPGVFEIWGANRNRAMDGSSGGYGDYRLENVPYAMYFDNDISLHGTYWHNGFGYRQSRGCVNLTISDARWLYEWMGAEGSVYVYYSQPY